MKNNKSDLSLFNDFELLVGAFRYYLGRMTAANIGFANDLARSWPNINPNIRKIIGKELDDAFKRDDEVRASKEECWKQPLGMDMDRKAWEYVREEWRKHG